VRATRIAGTVQFRDGAVMHRGEAKTPSHSIVLKPMLKIAGAKTVPMLRGVSRENALEILHEETNGFDVRTAGSAGNLSCRGVSRDVGENQCLRRKRPALLLKPTRLFV
jgi:hypothetical protein